MKDRSADPLSLTPDVGQPAAKPGFSQPATLTAALALIAAMYFAREILIPIVLAVILSFLVAPLVRLLMRVRIPQGVAVLISVVVPLAIVVLLAGVVGSQMANLAQSLPQYREVIDTKLKSAQDLANGKLGQFVGRAGQVIARVSSGEAPQPAAPPAGTAQRIDDAVQAQALPPAPSPAPAPVQSDLRGPPLTLVGHFLSALLGPLATAFIVLIVSIFMLLERNTVRDRFIKLIGARDSERTTIALDDTASRMSRYFVSQLGVNTGVGLVIGIGLATIGLPSPILWGVLAAMLRFIPYIGVWIAAALALLLAAAVEPGWTILLWTAGLFLVTELIAGQIVEPLLYGHTTGLSPLSVVVAAIFWSWLWGPVGLLLSTPLTLCLVVLGSYVERLNFLEILLGDKPQVTAGQQLYEQLGDRDVEAALKHAEQALKGGDAVEYYDGTLVPAFRLLAESVDGRTIDSAGLDAIRAGAFELLDELAPLIAEQVKGHASDLRFYSAVLIAARGPLDDVMSRAIAMLLKAHAVTVLDDGSGALPTVAPEGFHADSSRILVLSANPARSVSALHLTARRVHQVFPRAGILCGVYRRDDLQSKDHDTDDLLKRVTSVAELLRELGSATNP
jgi:predicted PurR-regulated permease PerM